MLWHDDALYYSQGNFLTYKPHISHSLRAEGGFQLINEQLRQFGLAMQLARVLNRTLVLPKLHCSDRIMACACGILSLGVSLPPVDRTCYSYALPLDRRPLLRVVSSRIQHERAQCVQDTHARALPAVLLAGSAHGDRIAWWDVARANLPQQPEGEQRDLTRRGYLKPDTRRSSSLEPGERIALASSAAPRAHVCFQLIASSQKTLFKSRSGRLRTEQLCAR